MHGSAGHKSTPSSAAGSGGPGGLGYPGRCPEGPQPAVRKLGGGFVVINMCRFAQMHNYE